MGTMLQIGSNVSKKFYLENMISKDIAKAHIDGYIHIHDLDFYALTPTCCQIDFEKLAKGGFCTGHGYLREPSKIESYATLAAIAIQSDQNDCHGGQSIPNFDYAMVPGIYKSFRKAWNKNVTKFKNFAQVMVQSETVDNLKYADNFTDELIEDILGFKSPSPSYCVMDKEDGFTAKCMYDKLVMATLIDVENECYQAMEGFVHNLNTLHSRAGGQVK
jgi:ribonucleoside-triphosphate reductase